MSSDTSQKPPKSALESGSRLSTEIDLSKRGDVRGSVFTLRVSDGPNVGAAIVLDGKSEGRILIGQSSVCRLRLPDDKKISRRHVALRREDHHWRLTDLGSKNGTRVNGVRVHECFLTGGETLALGDSTLRLTRTGVSSATGAGADGSGPTSATSSVFGRFITASPQLQEELEHWATLASSDLPILIEGETGVGKELVAEAIHDRSNRFGRPFVVLDCAGTAPSRAAGSILGEITSRGLRPGVFELAQGGTLLIDEPADLDIAAQKLLIGVLERGELALAASGRTQKLNVRVITTSRRDLDREVQEGRFREDLLYRLAGATIEVPALRHRTPTDISLLTTTFWAQLGGGGQPPQELLVRFAEHDWPGNVRELVNAVAERLQLGDEESIRRLSRPPASVPPPAVAPPVAPDVVTRVLDEGLPFPRARDAVLRELEERFVERALRMANGNVSKAAAASGLARRYFQILNARSGVPASSNKT